MTTNIAPSTQKQIANPTQPGIGESGKKAATIVPKSTSAPAIIKPNIWGKLAKE